MDELALRRITYRAQHGAPAPIKWPPKLAPKGTPYNGAPSDPLPLADVLVVTWTAAEGDALTGGVETVDYFGFADADDSFGIHANYPAAMSEEMNDATLPLAFNVMADPPPWCSIRNASDPQVPSDIGDLSARKQWASQIYEQYGYWTTIGSAIAIWAVIANL